MQKWCWVFSVLSLFALGAKGANYDGSFYNGCFSRYFFNGFSFSTAPVCQSTLTGGMQTDRIDSSLSLYINVGMGDEPPERGHNETDIFFSATAKEVWEDVDFFTGWGYFTFPGTDIKSGYGYSFGLKFKEWQWSPQIRIAPVVSDPRFYYVNFRGRHSWSDLWRGSEVRLSVETTYNNRYLTEKSGMSHVQMQSQWVFFVREKAELEFGLLAQKALRSDFKDQFGGHVAYGFSF